MRGKAPSLRERLHWHRITPAYAGKSRRVREPDTQTAGSPPRMRGKGLQRTSVRNVKRITPAYAGKRVKISLKFRASEDHPRVCGEKKSRRCCTSIGLGSPPRMRGKADKHCLPFFKQGITPAYAGKSRYLMRKSGEQKDHPRVCGEKELRQAIAVQHIGSPPRMRGKVAMFCRAVRAHRITPAYAGKREQAQ